MADPYSVRLLGSMGAVRAAVQASIANVSALREQLVSGVPENALRVVTGKGMYAWVPSSSEVDDGDTVLKPSSVSGAGRWKRTMFRVGP